MDSFMLLSSEHFHVILHPNQKHGLIFNRLDGSVSTINYDDAKELSNLRDLGRIYGIVGRYMNKYLVLIKDRNLVGTLYEPSTKTSHNVYVITRVQVINVPVSQSQGEISRASSVKYEAANINGDIEEPRSEAEAATDALDFSSLPVTISTGNFAVNQQRAAQWNPFKLANNFRPTQFLKSNPIVSAESSTLENQTFGGPNHQNNCQPSDCDKRLVEEMIKLFNNTDSFYYSPTLDLTNRFSRKSLVRADPSEPVWRTADVRFFWNRHMLTDLIELSINNGDANYFVCVILQGFIAIENHTVSLSPFNETGIESGLPATSINLSRSTQEAIDSSSSSDKSYPSITNADRFSPKFYQLCLISRRSVFQAGTRYKRRGCDEDGNCANFVETEQIFRFNNHLKSVVMIRGSIPLFWYQTGYNYRPPPVLVRSEEENHVAFSKHFNDLMKTYETGHIISIDCTEHTGREKTLHDAYKSHITKFSQTHPGIKLIEFDFHKYCRGRQCTDSQIEKHLKTCGLSDQMVRDAKYYWNDGEVVLEQSGVFRINCLDCSDRTNVVQRAIALKLLDMQLARLGIIAPDTCPEDNEFRKKMQQMWSENGNVLSTQYCGTRALFGGDRKLAGYLKDTYSSASRYYMSKFRDAYRQAAIDAMLGVETSEANQYELMNFDPLLTGKAGSALLKDVGNRVSNRLARLKGRFHVKPLGAENIAMSRHDVDGLEPDDPEIIEGTLGESLGALNIDWPSTESVGNEGCQTENAFTRYSNIDDSFQDDDEFGQLMLSIDLAELQRVRDNEAGKTNANSEGSSEKDKIKPEEINMTEARNFMAPQPADDAEAGKTSTTTT